MVAIPKMVLNQIIAKFHIFEVQFQVLFKTFRRAEFILKSFDSRKVYGYFK